MKLPNLTADGTDTNAKAVAGPLGLSVRGTGGEHTPIGKDGTVLKRFKSNVEPDSAELKGAIEAALA